MHDLIANLDKLHTTELGAERIRRNLHVADGDVVAWCKKAIEVAGNGAIMQQGKNWYCDIGSAVITVNAHSYTIITAHTKR